MEDLGFQGKVVYVTGAASGLGRLAAQRMADAGAMVAGIDVNQGGLQDTAPGRARIQTFVVDVTDTRAVAENVRAVEAALGPIDRVYSAAAIFRTRLLLEDGVTRGDLRARRGMELRHRTGERRHDHVVHLHGFEHREATALLHPLARRDEQLQQHAVANGSRGANVRG